VTSKSMIVVCDVTLRDGAHACGHQLSSAQISSYASSAESAGFDYLEVGHGNGLGASSLQVGQALLSDHEMLGIALASIRRTRLSCHVIPGFATIERDIDPALEMGVALFRVGCHCTEADITERHISHVRAAGRQAWGVLMMSHMAPADVLLDEAKKMQSYGAEGVVLMDSAGAFLPEDVAVKVGALARGLEVPVGFHAHDNLGLAIGNSLAAIDAGATIIDGTAKGFGAGAGNAPLEQLAAVMHRRGLETSVDLHRAIEASDLAGDLFARFLPVSTSITLASGLAGVFSGFAKPVQRVASEYGVDPLAILAELGQRKVVAGQEDLIVEVASQLADTKRRGDS
jgi:4-hydroxy 2-oxovalerate aldolase